MPLFETPKERFVKSSDHAEFVRMMTTLAMENGIDTALLQFVRGMPVASNPNDAAAAAMRLEGARSFIVTLRDLCLKEEPPKRKPTQNLNHHL